MTAASLSADEMPLLTFVGDIMTLVYNAAVPLSMRTETGRCEAVWKESCSNFSLASRNSVKKTSFLCSDIVKSERSRRLCTIFAASPPIDDPVVAAEPLTKEDLVGYLMSGCKPKENWR